MPGIIISGIGDPAKWQGYDIPAREDCEGWFLHGGDLALAAKNWVPGKPNLKAVGAPVVQDAYVSLKGATNYLEAAVGDFPQGTYAIVCRSLDTLAGNSTRPVFIGISGNNAGSSIYVPTVNDTRLISYETPVGGPSNSNNTALPTTLPKAAVSAWRLLIATYGPSYQSIRDMTNDVAVSENLPADRTHVRSTVPISIGGGAGISFTGTSDVAVSAYWSRQISDDEHDAVAARIRSFLGPRGITV